MGEIKLVVRCALCDSTIGADVAADWRSDIVVRVTPCEKCLEAAESRGEAKGYKEGYSEGHDAGTAEHDDD